MFLLFKNVVNYNDFIDLLAMRIPTCFHMNFHIFDDLFPLNLYQIEILLLSDLILFPLESTLNLFYSILSLASEDLIDLILNG